jgi:hypothetical protein
MLTLQQLLESDSIATLVAKLNQNFQSISTSNGGPQGIRGYQGIPGLPGRLGATGPAGPTGATGTILGIVPFACIPGTGPTGIGVGPTAGGGTPISSLAPYGTVGPWPQSSWQWLQYYETPGGGGFGGNTASHGDIYIDHSNNGYWQWLDFPDDPGACDGTGGFTSGGAYSYTGSSPYPALGPTAGWGGSGWYYYPVPSGAGTGATSAVWAQDFTTYLRANTGGTPTNGPYVEGQYLNNATSPLSIANARLITKYGTVWISSGNDATTIGDSANPDTPTIGNWGKGAGTGFPQPAKANAGVERILFKMSIDGMSYLSNITARGYTGTFSPGDQPGQESATHPITATGSAMHNWQYWVKPQYNVSLENYSPLLFLTHRSEDSSVIQGKYSSLGIYMYTDTTPPFASSPLQITGNDSLPYNNNNIAKSLHLFSTRFSPDPFQIYADPTLAPVQSNKTLNFGELLLDFRRVIASNQYVSSIPVDMRLSSDYVFVGDPETSYEENDPLNTNARRVFQGYISAINGKALTGNPLSADYWEYGLGATGVANATAGTHDASSGTAGMQTRQTWYGSSVLRTLPSQWNGGTNPGSNDYIRVAGMMERGRRFDSNTIPGGPTAGATKNSWFLSELLFYTSHFNIPTTSLTGEPKSVTNGQADPNLNQHKSLPTLYISPFRNIGIGTFVPFNDISGNAANDQGPLEPLARLHVHVKKNDIYNDPTLTYSQLTGATSTAAPWGERLPKNVYAAAAFTGEYGQTAGNPQYATDVLLGTLYNGTSKEYTTPPNNVVNYMGGLLNPAGDTYLTNALRSESWRNYLSTTLKFGAAPSRRNHSIGRGSVLEFPVEFQLALHPLTPTPFGSTAGGPIAIHTDPLRVISGVGIHNQYPRTRVHLFGKNAFNETDFGQQLWTPGYSIVGGSAAGPTASYPYYGTTATNSPSNNQIAIDYIGSSYTYPVGIYEYQYYAYGATANPSSTGSSSPNAAVYPNREVLSPTRHAVPWSAALNNSTAYPSIGTAFNNSWKHGGERNAWFPASSYIGFNLFRDLSQASGGTSLGTNTSGDDRDNTRWVIGTSPETADSTGAFDAANNGAAALMFSPKGELGIVTIPRGRDGGHPYHQWEQRGLGTRDVLNQMKVIFDTYGNIAIGNGAGWDLDAYPSLERNISTGYLNYVPNSIAALTSGPQDANTPGNTAGYWAGAGQYGRISYSTISPESGSASPAATINARATQSEYIRLEVAAEKAWSRDGRMAQKVGYGYPTNRTITINAPAVNRYILTNGVVPAVSSWVLITDNEGRIVSSTINLASTQVGLTAGNFPVITFPHPTEFNKPGGPLATATFAPALTTFTAPAGSIAAEWWGMSIDTPPGNENTIFVSADQFINPFPTTDTRGSANIRLNNYVYGEGYGFSGPTGQQGTGSANVGNQGQYTQNLVKQKRQESPKIVMSFLEKDPTSSRVGSGLDPYKKVNTVIASAQNESSLREYWIPKTDNTGGTFMVWTDNMGQKEKDSGFDRTLTSYTGLTSGGATGPINKLKVVEVIALELLASYTAGNVGLIATAGNLPTTVGSQGNAGFVRYYNQASGSWPGNSPLVGGLTAAWAGQYGQISRSAANVPTTLMLGENGTGTTGASLPVPRGGNTATVFASTERNIDYYYKVYVGEDITFNATSPNVPDYMRNKATEIRYKRINSEYVLFDFNITLEVMNPTLPGGTTGALNSVIDGFSPRMTQAVKFVYEVDEDEDNDYTENLYGSGPWFSSWSTWRNWHAGAAAVGGLLAISDPADNIYATWFDRQLGLNFGNILTRVDDATWLKSNNFRTWNGNLIDVNSYGIGLTSSTAWFWQSIFSYSTSDIGSTGNNWIAPLFGPSPINLSIATYLADYGNLPNLQASIFGAGVGALYSVWGNHTLGRHRNMMWKVTPIRWTNNTVNTGVTTSVRTRNTFMIDVSFDVPIMHCSHELSNDIFINDDANNNYSPYKYLTLSGQHILRYGKTEMTISPGGFPGNGG